MTTLRLSQVRFSVTGSCARARQKLLTKSLPRVARMSAKTARAAGESSSSLSSLTVAMRGLQGKGSSEALGAERRGVHQRRLARHHLRQQPAADRTQREPPMLVAEVEPEALQTRRWADDRQHVGPAGPSSEPGLVVAPREFRSGRESQAARHRRDEIALFEIEHGTAEPGVAARRIVHVIAALDPER